MIQIPTRARPLPRNATFGMSLGLPFVDQFVDVSTCREFATAPGQRVQVATGRLCQAVPEPRPQFKNPHLFAGDALLIAPLAALQTRQRLGFEPGRVGRLFEPAIVDRQAKKLLVFRQYFPSRR